MKTSVPDWDAVADLYEALAREESRRPGSPRAGDLEAAIDLLLAGRITSTKADFHGRDALRRARFLRGQAVQQRPAALARRGCATFARATVRAHGDDDAPDLPEPFTTVTPEDIVCACDTARGLAASVARHPRGSHAATVLAGLLDDLTPDSISARLGVSRSSVDRCTRLLRDHATETLVAA